MPCWPWPRRLLPLAQDTAPKVRPGWWPRTSPWPPAAHVTVALEEKIRAGWHTYWINPGDAGAPTEIQWTLPPGWKRGRHPMAHAQAAAGRLPLMDYGYEGTLWLLSDLTVPADAKPGDTVTLKAAASWLVCQQICVPEEATLTLT